MQIFSFPIKTFNCDINSSDSLKRLIDPQRTEEFTPPIKRTHPKLPSAYTKTTTLSNPNPIKFL